MKCKSVFVRNTTMSLLAAYGRPAGNEAPTRVPAVIGAFSTQRRTLVTSMFLWNASPEGRIS